VSRVMSEVATPEHLAAARRFRQIYSTYERNRDLISVGAYHAGSDPRIDEAIRYQPRLERFLQQSQDEPRSFAQSVEELQALVRDTQQEDEA